MEMANHWSETKSIARRVRKAEIRDKADIMLLLQNGGYTHVHLDWRPPADWVGEEGFVVVPAESKRPSLLSSMVFGTPSQLAACLAAVADPAPAAWVRVVGINKEADEAQALLGAMLERVTGHLRDTAVSELGWLVMDEWPRRWLPSLGFHPANEIVTYVKYDMAIPTIPSPNDLTIRPVRVEDMDILAHIEAAAFEPLWRHSASGLRQAYQQAFSFDVAEKNGRIVGFQYSTSNKDNAHLVRMTILPDLQRNGIGSALLTRAIQGYKQSNLRYITLNTQIDNYPSQKLYTKFGFQARGQHLPIWVKPITANTIPS